MPNWCSNFISIEGSKENIKLIKRMLDTREGNKGIFETLIGRDETITKEMYDNGGWYESNIQRYGCKWDINFDDVEIQIDDESICFNCDTAWSPPTNFCTTLSEMYNVKVRCEYEENGCDFAGYHEVDDGDIDTQTYSYLEGIYHNDGDHLFHELESRIEYAIEEGKSYLEFIRELTFLDESELEEVKEMWDKEVEKQKQVSE